MPSPVPRWSRRLRPKRREVMLSASIEYAQTKEQSGMRLGEKNQELDISSRRLQDEAKRVIEDRLPADLADLFGIDAKVEVRGCRFGSLIVFFSVLLSGYGLIASYKDFYDSIQLIKEHCNLLLRTVLRDNYPHHDFKVEVETRYPTLPNPHDLYSPSRYWKRLGLHPSELPWELWESAPPPQHARRDGFFWFLLVLSTVLLGVLGVLVYAAVVQTYFS